MDGPLNYTSHQWRSQLDNWGRYSYTRIHMPQKPSISKEIINAEQEYMNTVYALPPRPIFELATQLLIIFLICIALIRGHVEG